VIFTLLNELFAWIVDKLYVVGGSDSQTSLVSVEIFDFVTGLWTSGPSLGTPRANMGVAIVHRRLFAVGGFSGKAFLDSVEFLSDDGEQWCAYQPAGVTTADNGCTSECCSSSLSEHTKELDSILQISVS